MARNKHPEETVDLILDASFRLFMNKGYEHTSIQDIINRLGGLSKGAIYHHFKSKEDILLAVTNRMTEESNRILAAICNRSDLNGKEKLKAILKEHDDIIVNTISRYVIPDGYKVVELESFQELMDARNSLEKPIVYERINNIKSKFYLEDDKTIYLYSMKDEGK